MDLFGQKRHAELEKQIAQLSARVDANYALAFAALHKLPPNERMSIDRSLRTFVADMGDLIGVGLFDDKYQQVYRDEISRIMQRMIKHLQNPPKLPGE